MADQPSRRISHLEPMAWTLTAAIVMVDLLLPPGYAVGVLYVGVILASLSIPRRAFLFQFAVVATGLELLGLIGPQTGGDWRMGVFNRALSIGALWITAGGIALYRRESEARDAVEARLREQAAFAELGKMAAAVAHEVRNALTGIGSSLQIVYELAPPHASEVDIRSAVTERLAALSDTVTDLLAFVETRPMVTAPVSLRLVVEQAVLMARGRPSCAAVEIELDVADVPIRADRDQLARAIFNLILNAAQAMHDKGRVSVRARSNGQGLRIEVEDRGPGITPAARARLFEPFFSTKGHGVGLGLAFAKRVASSHGGTIDLQSPVDGGTVAVLTMPIRAAALAPATQPS